MAKKTISKEQRYREALELSGILWENVRAVSYTFPDEKAVTLFHYALMMKDVPYFLFDAIACTAIVLYDKDNAEAPKRIAGLAAYEGGIERPTDLR